MVAVLGAAAAGRLGTADPRVGRRDGTARRSAGSSSATKIPRTAPPRPRQARDVVLTPRSGGTWCAINNWVNETIKPVTDMEHWGVVERWSYPDDGKGDCEDYVLLKRRMLMQAGWPREALLITVVRDQQGRRPCRADRENRPRRFHPRQPGRRRPALVRHRLPLRQAPVAEQSQCLGGARRPTARHFHRRCIHTLSIRSYAVPVTSPPSPSPDRVRARPASPNAGRTFLESHHSCAPKLSADPLQPLGVLLPALDIDVSAAGDHGDGFLVDRRGSPARASRQSASCPGTPCPPSPARPRRPASSCQSCAVEQDRTHADQAVVANRAAVQHHLVADHTILRRSPSGSPDRCAAWRCPGSASASPSSIHSLSPRSTAPNQTLAWLLSRTRPISTAVSATQ